MAGSSGNLGSGAFVTFSSADTPENLCGLGSFGITSLGGITQNLPISDNFRIRSSPGLQISSTVENQFRLSESKIVSFSDHYTSATPRNHLRSNESRNESASGTYMCDSSIGLGASLIRPSSGPNINRAYVGLNVSRTRPINVFGSTGSENVSPLANRQNSASDNWEIYYGPGGIRMGPSDVARQNQNNNFYMEASSGNNYQLSGYQRTHGTQQNNVLINGDTLGNRLGLRDIRLESSSITGQNIRPRRGRPLQSHPTPRQVGTGSSSRGKRITRSSSDRETSVNRSLSGPVVSESVSNGRPIRVAEIFSGDKRLHSKIAEAEDWTKEEKAIVEEELKVMPRYLSKEGSLAWLSTRLEKKTARDVAMLLNYFMEERSAKRIRVDTNVTTDNDREEQVPDPSPSSSRIAGSFDNHAQGTAANNQGVPAQLTLQETRNAAPPQPQLRVDEEMVDSVFSPTFDPDMLLDLPYSPGTILEDLKHLELPPPGEAENHDPASDHGNR